ncbi:MAG: serine hydrolase, partial [Blastocatellia bacterium]
RWNYNNSGYVLLGAVIEKASGMKYADFVEKNIFAPLGMKRSFYDSTSRIIPRRAAGYSKSKDGYVNADYLSMSWPHAAGSLISTVDDLALWDAALYTDKILKQESLKRAWKAFSLNDGRPAKYGYGWGLSTIEGHPAIGHGGGINGFTCDALRLPDDRVYVAILTNRDAGTGNLTRKIGAMAAGIVLRDPVAVKMPAETFDKYAGVYQIREKEEAIVTRDGEKFFVQHPMMGRREILPMSETEFFGKENPSLRVTFLRAGGAVTGLKFVTGMLPDDEAKRTDKPLPKPAVVDAAIYDRYVGEYELMPGFNIAITKEGGKLMGEPTGQPKLELVPESPTKFAIREVSAQVEFIVEGDRATGFNYTQRGRTTLAKRLAKQDGAKQELPPIRNFLRVNQDFCTGGQPRLEHLEKLKADGIKTIINLRPPGEHRAAEEEEMAKKLGLRYINIPVVYATPKEEDADAFLKATDDKEDRPAFIHCAAAIRVGAFWMIRRVLRDGMSVEAAEEEAKKVGLVNAPHLTEFAKKYIETHRKSR